MATTPRLLLYKPVGSDLVNPVAAISDQMAIIDSIACKTLVSDEASPPTAQFTGQEWFTRDSHKFYYWTGSAWQQITLPSVGGTVPAGRKGFSTTINSSRTFEVTGGQEKGPQLHVECSVISGRIYRVYTHCVLESDDVADNNRCRLRLRVSSGASVVTTSGTKFCETIGDFLAVDTGSTHCRGSKFFIGKWTASFTGSASFGLFIAKGGGDPYAAGFSPTDTGISNVQYMCIEEVSI